VCNYVEDGSMSVGWNGDVSPCWPLLHTHGSYLHGKPRGSVRHVIGNVRERALMDLWLDPAYIAYRERVQGFGFPPCTFCGGCDISDANVEDCFGNPFPTCSRDAHPIRSATMNSTVNNALTMSWRVPIAAGRARMAG
jgi:MoaA/NifB/PqqE/SkfB family radical SAM enzyme